MTSVRLTITDAVARITLCRPDSLNAFDLDLARRLRGAVAEVAASGAEALVLAGEGRVFSAGGDVREMAASADASSYLRDLTADMHAALAALRELPIPVIARVQGAVAGGGLGLVLAADLVVASEAASFTAAYGAIGLSPDCGVTILLPAVVGAARARAFLLGGGRWDSATAYEYGLIAQITTAEGLDEAVMTLVTRARKAGRGATAATKALLDVAAYRAHLDREAVSISDLAGGAARERIAAFAAHT